MKIYIGDGVYIEQDGSSFILTTEDGASVTNRIILESEVVIPLILYIKRAVGAETFYEAFGGE